MLTFQLFRLKVFPPSRLALYHEDRTPSEWIRAVIEEGPEAELWSGVTWHVGNVLVVDESSHYFALGKTTRASLAQFDPGTKTFHEVQFEEAPFTHVFVDRELGLCAIAQKPRLSPTAKGIGRQFEKLLNRSRVVSEAGVEFELAPVADPESLVEYIQRSYSVTKFWMSFGRPNPINVDELIHRPLQRMLRETGGESGEAMLKGDDLDKDALSETVRSLAATGNDASACLQETSGSRPVRRHLFGAAVELAVEEVDERESKVTFMVQLRGRFDRLRGGGGR